MHPLLLVALLLGGCGEDSPSGLDLRASFLTGDAEIHGTLRLPAEVASTYAQAGLIEASGNTLGSSTAWVANEILAGPVAGGPEIPYTISGVAPGSYGVYVRIDGNRNGVFAAGEGDLGGYFAGGSATAVQTPAQAMVLAVGASGGISDIRLDLIPWNA
jgi:hypothetical protein